MNRQQRRAAGDTAAKQERLVVEKIMIHFTDGSYTQVDLDKVNVAITTKDTGVSLFTNVQEGEAR